MTATKIIVLMFLCSIAEIGTIIYASDTAAAETSTEVKKTVDSFNGHWIFEGTDTEPGAKPANVRMVIDCKPVALGAAVACTLVGQIFGFGPIEAASVVGYSPDERLVHWMEISSTREYHDHKGPWKGDTIEFEPLLYTVCGKKYLERFALSFPSRDTLVIRAITKTPDGPSLLEGTGRK